MLTIVNKSREQLRTSSSDVALHGFDRLRHELGDVKKMLQERVLRIRADVKQAISQGRCLFRLQICMQRLCGFHAKRNIQATYSEFRVVKRREAVQGVQELLMLGTELGG